MRTNSVQTLLVDRGGPCQATEAEMAKGAKGLKIGYDEAYCSKGVEARVTGRTLVRLS